MRELRFLSAHRPDPELADGVYTVTVSQSLVLSGQRVSLRPVTKRFAIAGEHRTLTPADVVAVYPPEGSLGDHATTLPHIVLRRSTLPWERAGGQDDSGLPWLAVLLLDEEDTAESTVKSLTELKGLAEFAHLTPVPGQSDEDRYTVLGVAPDRLTELLPTAAELALLAHVRQQGETGRPADEDLAVVVGNRLPRGGRASTAHLVSVFGRYRGGAFDTTVTTGGLVHVVSLKSWRFASIPAGASFETLVTALNRTPATVSLPAVGKPTADPYLVRGFVALPHRLRQADRAVSWYHGPLGPQRTAATGDGMLPVRTADALLRIDGATGMLDVSYAAAWQVGRLLALQSRRFSTAYGVWRRAHRRASRLVDPLRETPVPVQTAMDTSAPDVPTVVRDWLTDLGSLVDVPFNYLVPDDRMLPAESFRAFTLDGLWTQCLLDGALSLGRITQGDEDYESAHLAFLRTPRYPVISGCLLRSALIPGWPRMRIDAYDAVPPADGDLTGLTPLTSVRTARLSDTVQLWLFAGDVSTFHIHLPPEILHLGVDRDATVPTGYTKLLRDAGGTHKAGRSVPVRWRAGSTRQVIDVGALAAGIGSSLSAAGFAKQMMEGAPRVLLRRALSFPGS
ncbi:hypothetical protein [Cryptosporangium phraense]|uniref:Uncharacterized protein n=1 Tax=Cryptosporangium phraense TaxID=2593070 RepID=A0A545AF66_9ACTN|nr:hypothetical protein [Cryptosporangium phraense]TQS39953.1 hypothetical protein FL583_37355 [Cryptosporangium phraense]